MKQSKNITSLINELRFMMQKKDMNLEIFLKILLNQEKCFDVVYNLKMSSLIEKTVNNDILFKTKKSFSQGLDTKMIKATFFIFSLLQIWKYF
jgi:hypothetical protein